MEQLTEEQAIQFHETRQWQKMSLDERACFQLRQKCLCMPFDKFHESVEHALGRPVWTHEFADANRLLAELEGRIGKPTMEQIIDLLKHKHVIIVGHDEGK